MENEDDKGYRQIEVTPVDFVNKAMLQIKRVTDSAAFFYHAGLNYNPNTVLPLQTNSLPILINDNQDQSPAQVKETAFHWLWKKSLEDFVSAIFDSLIESYKILRYFRLSTSSKRERRLSEIEMESEIEEIQDKPHKMHIPVLIGKVEKEIKGEILLKKEILSINNLRNCLVHRNGVVTKYDVNDESRQILYMDYLDLITFVEHNNQIKELTWDLKKAGIKINSIQFAQASKTLEVKLGAQVGLDQNIINAVSYTCITFCQTLYSNSVLPIISQGTPETKKG